MIPNNALIEGLAEAYDLDDAGQTLAQRARALRDLGHAPDLIRILSPTGFLAEAPSRAYTYAGAFIRYLRATEGGAAVRAVYASGDLRSAGDPAMLVEGFERSLDTVHVDVDTRVTAAFQFAAPSLFVRRCAREVSRLTEEGFRLALIRDYAAAIDRMDQACELQPESPRTFYDRLTIALRDRSLDTARLLAVARPLWEHPAIDPLLAASSRVLVGDELWRRGYPARARGLYGEAWQLPLDNGTHRTLLVRIRALADSSLAELLLPLLAANDQSTGQMFRLAEAARARPGDALLRYLVGRQLWNRSAWEAAAEHLAAAERLGLGDGELTREALRMQTEALSRRHRCDESQAARERLRAAGGSAGADAVAADWVARCNFARGRGWAPLQF
jgi:hypothetical protein